MDSTEYVDNRRKRYLSLTLAEFDQQVMPRLQLDRDPALREVVERFKQTVRSQFREFAVDLTDLIDWANVEVQVNPAGVDIRDRIATTR